MMAAMSLIKRMARVMLGAAGLASWFAMPFFAMLSASAGSLPVKRESNNRTAIRKADQSAIEAYNKLPLSFEARPNNPTAKFVSRGNGYNFYLSSTEAVFQLQAGQSVRRLSRGAALGSPRNAGSPSAVQKLPEPLRDEVASRSVQLTQTNIQSSIVKMRLIGADPRASVVGLNELPGKGNYITGNDPAKWRANALNYSKVKIENAYKGVDVIYYGNNRQLEHDFNVAPGADFRVIRLCFGGARKIRLDSSGDLVIETAAGELRQHKPVAYQEANGARREVSARYALKSSREIMFDVGDYDKSLPLVIDPILSYSTFLGSNDDDLAACIAVDSAGNAYIAGYTTSTDFPVTPDALQSVYKSSLAPFDVFVAKINASGNALLYSTYIGGNSVDIPVDIALDAAGNAYVTGTTFSSDFPITAGAYQRRLKDNIHNDGFAFKLNASGSGLFYSTYIGGNGIDSPSAIAIDSTGNAYLAGSTGSNDFPTTPGAINTSGEAFVTKLNETGRAIVYSTFLDGNEFDYTTDIALDADNNIYVTGGTHSSDFPLRNPLQRKPGGNADVFIAKIDANTTTLVYSTYLGGNDYDAGGSIAVDSSGSVYVAGVTWSSDFPTTQGVFQSSLKGSLDVFVAKLSPSGKKLVYSTLLGGTRYDQVAGIAVDSSGYVYLTGSTSSRDFPTMNPLQDHKKSDSLYKSIDGGNSWQVSGNGLDESSFYNLVLDPKTPSTLYASGYQGVFKSTDSGATWKPSLSFLSFPAFTIGEMAIDPVNTLNVYIALGDEIFKTSDGGATWKRFKVTPGYDEIKSIAIDPKNPSVIYAGIVSAPGGIPALSQKTQANFLPEAVFKSIDGGETWTGLNLETTSVRGLAIDPVNTSTIYASSSFGIFKSTDAGFSWVPINNGVPKQAQSSSFVQIEKLVIDPQNPDTVYGVGRFNGIIRSTNGGESWNHTDSPINSLVTLAIDPQNTNTLYATGSGGFLKSTRGGEDLRIIGLDDVTVLSIAVDPVSPSTVYVTAFDTGELFVAKLNQDGTDLAYSTYLGGVNTDSSGGIVVDSAGSVYVTGSSYSKDFPATQASFQPNRSKLSDSFILKIRDPRISTVTGVSIKGKKLIVTGRGFDRGAVILVNGIQQKTANDEVDPSSTLIAKKAAKQIERDQNVNIQVRNTDGTESAPFPFRR